MPVWPAEAAAAAEVPAFPRGVSSAEEAFLHRSGAGKATESVWRAPLPLNPAVPLPAPQQKRRPGRGPSPQQGAARASRIVRSHGERWHAVLTVGLCLFFPSLSPTPSNTKLPTSLSNCDGGGVRCSGAGVGSKAERQCGDWAGLERLGRRPASSAPCAAPWPGVWWGVGWPRGAATLPRCSRPWGEAGTGGSGPSGRGWRFSPTPQPRCSASSAAGWGRSGSSSSRPW